MPKPRFHSIDAARRDTILRVAAEEFSQHGYDGASYNHIIERIGSSKGTMYYYFSGKADLFGTVLADCLGRYLAFVGPLEPATDPEGFWRIVHRATHNGLLFYRQDPIAAGLTRGVARAVARGETLAGIGASRALMRGWLDGFLRMGQAVGAIRSDLPDELLISVTLSLSEGIDVWWADQLDAYHDGDDDLDALASKLADLYRRLGGLL